MLTNPTCLPSLCSPHKQSSKQLCCAVPTLAAPAQPNTDRGSTHAESVFHIRSFVSMHFASKTAEVKAKSASFEAYICCEETCLEAFGGGGTHAPVHGFVPGRAFPRLCQIGSFHPGLAPIGGPHVPHQLRTSCCSWPPPHTNLHQCSRAKLVSAHR